MSNIKHAVIFLVAGYSIPAQAMDAITDEVKLAANVNFQSEIQAGGANGPLDRSLSSQTKPEIQLLATEGEKRVSLGWSFSLSPDPLNHIPSSNSLFYDQFSLTVSTPLDSSGETQLFSLDGFSGGTDVKLSWTHFMGKIGDPSANPSQIADETKQLSIAMVNCRNRFEGSKAADIKKQCDPRDNSFVGGSISSFMEKYNYTGFAKVYEYYFPEDFFPFFGLEVSGNQAKFSYLDVPNFASESESKFGYNAGIFGGVLLTKSATSISSAFNYSRTYKKKTAITLCQAINVTQTQCLTGANGMPSVKKTAVVSLEARHAFNAGKGASSKFAIAPEISYDFKNESYSVDVPLYFFPDSNGQLKGGIRAKYLNERDLVNPGKRKDGFTVGLFLGVPFKLPF